MTDRLYSDCFYTSDDGLRLHYRDYIPFNNQTPKATYLCMPGLTRNANDFIIIAEFLQSQNCRVICAEQRGRGDSQWDENTANYIPDVYVKDMFKLVEEELHTPEDLYLIGTSLGGLMSIMMNAMRPGLIKGIIINDMGMEVNQKGLDRIKSYVGVDVDIKTWDDAIREVKRSNTVVYPNYTDAEWDHFTRLLYVEKDGIPTANYDPAIGENLNNDTETAAPTLWPLMDSLKTVPLVIIRGALSDILSHDVAEKMQEIHPDMTLVTVPDVGHCPTFSTAAEQSAILNILI